MADNLIFPIGFDLEEAVKKAGQEWNSTYADKLEKLLAKRAITVNLGFSTKNLNNLDDVKRRLAELKIEPLTPENKTAIKDLVRELKELAKAMEKVQKYSKIQTPELQQALANKANAEAAHMAEKYRQANERLEVSKRRVALAEQKHAEALSNTSKKINEQHSYVSRLIKRMAVYASFSYAGNFLTSVREVTAQFELQRVSLGAIIQDQTRANALFSEIKAFALKSPVSILDLTKYTKQIAAYRIETEKLFDTTKMLTDISVGLGVDLQRITLFFGQVRARGALFSSEIRQATEAGIPLVELLAKKYSELNGQLVTASQVLKMVEKGMVGFEMVEEIFKDMTSAGGMFYEMQEKQGNTLYGLWAKLGDAAAVMYDEIGNTSSVNAGMKAAIQALTDLMKNWRDVARIATEAGIAFAVYRLAVIASTKATALATVWEKKDIVLRQMHLKTVMAQSMHVRNFNRVLLASGVSAQKASTATWVFSRALHGLKAAIATTGIGALIIGLALLIDRLLFSKSAAEQLKESLDNIETESIQEQDKSVRNFERLANIAVSASSTYKEQQAALEELKRTYKEIIPQEQLTIENLKQMNGNYELLTASIRRYIAERMKQKQTDEIINTYASEILKIQRKVNDQLKNKYSAEQLAAFWEKYTEIVKDASKSAGKSVSELINMTVSAMGADLQFAHDIGSVWTLFAHDHADVSRMTTLIREQERQIDALSKTYDSASMAMGEYAKSYSEAVDKITQDGLKLNGKVIKQEDNPLLYSQQEANLEIKDAMIPTIKEAFNAAGIAFNDGWTSLIDNVDENMPQLTSSINFDPMVEKVNEESQKLLAELQKQLDALVAQREAYRKQIKAEESKGKGDNDEVIQNAKTRYNEIGDEIEKLEERARKINILPQLLEHLKKKYEDLAPSDSVVKLMRQRFDSIVDYTKAYAKNMRRFRMNADEDMEAYRKRLSDEVELIKKNIKAWTAAMILARLFRNKTEEQNLQNLIDEAKLQLKDLEKILGDMPVFEKGRGSGRQSDPRLQNLKEEISLVQKLYNEYKQLENQEGATKAAADMRRMAGDTLDMFKSKYNIDLPTDAKDLTAALEVLYNKMAALPKKVFPALDKDLKELRWTIEKVDIDESQKNIEAELKRLADRISRTKTAKEFYEKILGMTGDYDLAAKVSLSIYGSTGEELFEDTVRQIREVFKSGNKDVEIDLSPVFDMTNQRINYKALADIYDKYQDQIIEKNRSTAENIVKEGQKIAASNITTWEKELAKAKDYEEQRTDIINRETQRRAEIYKSNLPQEEKDRLAAQSQRKQDEDLAKVNFEEFTKSEDYIKIFENLDNVATSSLKRLRAEMQALIDTNQNLSPENMKTLVKAMEDIDEQISGRGFGNDMIQSVNDYIASIKNLKIAKQELTAAEAEYQAQLPQLDENIALAEDEKVEAQRALNDLKNNELATENQIIAAQLRLNTALANVEKAEQAKAKAANKVKKAEHKVTGEQDKQKKATTKFVKDLQKAGQAADQLAGTLGDIKAFLGIAEDSAAGLVFDSAIEGLQQMSNLIGIVTAAQMLYNVVTESNPWMAIAAAVLAVISALSFGIGAAKVRKANKEIERQQNLLDQLEYTYGRLEKAADKVFGTDYVNNYQQQIKNLQAQQTAYLKQAEAERSKGKKKDKDKIKEYEEQARETADKIKELQDDLVAHFTGQSRTDVARQMAKSWIDARASMSDTFAAIKGDYADMVKNMLVEGAAARVIENALTPVWDSMEKMLAKNDVEGAIDSLVNGMDSALTQANNGMEVLWKALEARGYDMKQLIGDTDSEYTGIAKSVAGATSEEINNVAAIGNTLMYYVSPIPRIDENLARVVALMEGRGASAIPQTTSAGWTDWQQQAMDNYQAIARNTAETVVRCERAAIACEKMASTFKVKGSTKGLNVFLNQ
jgi:hypothetical protein